MHTRGLRGPLALAVLAASTGCLSLGPGARPRPSYVAQHVDGGSATNLSLAPVVVFQDGSGSLSYHAPTYADLPAHVEVRDVQGRACESGLQVPWGVLTQPSSLWLEGLYASVGWGDSGYQRALRDAANQVAPDAMLYDVRADLQTINVLSIWRQSCIVVTASAVTRLPSDDAALTTSPAEAGTEAPPAAAQPSAIDGNAPAKEADAPPKAPGVRSGPTPKNAAAPARSPGSKPGGVAPKPASATAAPTAAPDDPSAARTPVSPAPGGAPVGVPTLPSPSALQRGSVAEPNTR